MILWAICTLVLVSLGVFAARTLLPSLPTEIDPAAWGSDHVGQPVPEYVTGDQCLFCHRDKIGPTWGVNRHNLTIRAVDEQTPALKALNETPIQKLVEEIKYVMGNRLTQRFLKPADEYGQLELLSTSWIPPHDGLPGKFTATENPHWDAKQFGNACAGCHTTAVDSKTKAFSALSLDCFACHGNVDTEHPNKPELAYLSPRRKDSAAVITSICAQCHIRTGHSRSTGLPYPNNFVAGDNLFRDYHTNLSDAALRNLSNVDRHVMENIREVVILGNEAVTCLTCHDVHGRSSRKHRLLSRTNYCLNCHNIDGPMIDVKPFSTHSKTCGY